MAPPRTYAWIAAVSLSVLGVYAILSLTLPQGESLNAFGNIMQCLVPLLANAGLLLNAGTPHWRRNVFWMLTAMSCTLWMIGQFQWTYYEVYLHQPLPDLYPGDIIFFLRGVPLMAALGLRPHLKRGEMQLRFGYLDFVLLLSWWVFLYVFVVLPWMYAEPSLGQYNFTYDVITNVQNMVTVIWFGVLWLQSRRAWRTVYAHLFGADVMYMEAKRRRSSRRCCRICGCCLLRLREVLWRGQAKGNGPAHCCTWADCWPTCWFSACCCGGVTQSFMRERN